MFERLIESWGGEQVLVRYDRPTGGWIFICMHSRRLGPAGGGTRLQVYETPADGLRDAMRLAEGMTVKMAVAGVPFGGGKAVLAMPAIPQGEERRGLLERYADAVASLGGNYWTGPDMNTTSEDMDAIGERCPYVFSRSAARGGSGDPGPFTARGVFHGIRATLERADGSTELEGRSVLVQGVGSVGGVLARLLAEAGTEVLVSDVDGARAERLASELGARIVPAESAIETPCDVYAPCAMGGTLAAGTIPRLRCRVVAGSANNQLAESADAERLRHAGILYAPDYVISSGGVLYGVGSEALGWDAERIEEELRGIGATLAEIYERAKVEGTSTHAAAERVAATRLA